MTKRAFFWHGALSPPLRDSKRRPRYHWDFPAAVRDFDFAFQACLSLGVDRDEMYAFVCSEDVLPEGFGNRRYPAMVSSLMQVVEHISARASEDDALIFIAGNHGLPGGLLASPPTDQRLDEFSELSNEARLLTPAALGECLSMLDGPQIVLLVTCHAGVFLHLGERQNRLILAGCSAHEIFEVEDEERPHSPFLIKLLGSWCGIALPGDVPPSRRYSLDDAFDITVLDLEAPHRTKPLRNGAVRWP